jgi:DNA gyrase inhibitor GyrI
MPAFHISRSVTVEAPIDRVVPAIEDFNVWPKWSPWLYMEPEAKVDVYGTVGQAGHGYTWSGELVGAGEMKLREVAADRTHHMDLTFLKPFKSKASVSFEIAPTTDSQTQVSWHMHGSMPFFLFFMVPTMKGMIGMDYERGLRMLKEHVETGAINSATTIEGIVDVPAIHWVGASAEVAMSEIGDSMHQSMPQALKTAEQAGASISGPPGVIYDNMDIKNQRCRYTAFVPVAEAVDASPNGTIEGGKALKVIHTGRYDHLGNSWSTAMTHQRHHKMKPSKSQAPYEIYVSDPADTPEAELVTEIYLPLR